MNLFSVSLRVNITFALFFIFTFACIGVRAQGDNCFDANPFCTGTAYNFPNSTGTSAPSGPNYGCLGSEPNPVWYYMKIGTSGSLQLGLSQTDVGGSGIDVDFAMWGPFTDVNSACTQIMAGTAPPIQCSYSSSYTETIGLGLPGGTGSGASTPPNAVVGQYYLVLMTNFSGQNGNIQLSQTGGTGATDCTILSPCSVNNLNVTIGACDPSTSTFDISGTVDITNPPSSGSLIAEDCNGNQTVIDTYPFGSTTYSFNINNINSDGAACNLKVYFSADATCTQQVNYTNPAPCSIPCTITNFEVYDTAQCNQVWKSDVVIEFTNPPTSGDLVVEDCQGHVTVIDSYPFSSPATGTFSTTTGSPTPFNCAYTTYFTADPSCTLTNTFSPLPATPPADEAGTFTENMSGDGTHTYVLCDGDVFNFFSNNDANIPPIAPGNDPSVIYFVYKCPPSPGGPGIDPSTDPCLVGFIQNDSLTLVNNGGSSDPFLTSLGALTNNTFYIVPMTVGSLSGLTYQANCYDLSIGDEQTVQYLNPITYTVTPNCQTGTVTVSNLQGGYPQFYGGNYTGSNLTPGTASFSPGSAGLGGSIVVTGLNDGDNYSFDITDGNGCPVTITGTFVGKQDPSFTYPSNVYCTTDPNPSPTITGVPGGTFSVSPAGLTVNPSTGVINLASAPAGGTFTITYTTPDPVCFDTQTFVVTVNPTPTFTLSSTNPTTCVATDGTITISGLTPSTSYTVSYDGNPASAMSSDATGKIVLTGLAAGSYSPFIVTAGGGCSTTNNTVINLVAPAAPTVSATGGVMCVGGNVTISSSGTPAGGTYSWDNGAGASATANVSPAATTIYTVTYTSVGCTATDTAIVTVNPLPIVNAGSDQTICSGASVTLSGSGATTYTWDNGITDGVSFTPASTTTYTVTGTDGNGCVNTDQIIVTLNPLPTFTLSSTNPSTCTATDGSITISGLTPSTNYTISFNGGASTGMSSDAGGNIVLSGLGSGNYSPFTVTTIAGCSTTDNTIITLIAPAAPTVSASGGAMCVGGNVTISSSGTPVGGTYSWNNGAGTSPTANVSPASTTVYTVTYTSGGCTVTDTAIVQVNPLPPVNAGTDQTLCDDGTQITLSGSGASTYTWDNGVTNGTPFSQAVGTTTYTVNGTDGNGCVNTDQVNVTVNPLPNVNAGTDQTLCNNGTQITLNGAGAVSYTWNNGVTNGTAFSQAVGTTSYIVAGTDANGCINWDTVNVTVNPLPPVNAGVDQTVCVGTSVTLSGSGASTYTWNNGVTNGTAFTPSVGTVAYTVTGTDGNGCTNTDQVNVTVNPLPNVVAGNDVIVCQVGTVILTGAGAVNYTWNNGVTNGVSFPAPSDTTTYVVTGTDANGCVNKDSLVVNVVPTPVVNFTADRLSGCSPLSVQFTNNSTGNLTDCQWSFSNGQNVTGCGTVSGTFTQTGCYDVTLTVSTPEGCTNTATIADYVCVDPNPVADFTTDPTELSTEEWTAHMVNSSTNASTYQWTFGDGSASSNDFAPSHDYPNEQSGTYLITLFVTSDAGCVDSTTRTIHLVEHLIFYVPNTFTPDHDNFNETFKPIFTSGFDPYDYSLLIFDRWGELLFESHNTEVGWDGTYGGKIVQDGTYIWKIDVKRRDSDEHIRKIGHVNVLR